MIVFFWIFYFSYFNILWNILQDIQGAICMCGKVGSSSLSLLLRIWGIAFAQSSPFYVPCGKLYAGFKKYAKAVGDIGDKYEPFQRRAHLMKRKFAGSLDHFSKTTSLRMSPGWQNAFLGWPMQIVTSVGCLSSGSVTSSLPTSLPPTDKERKYLPFSSSWLTSIFVHSPTFGSWVLCT